MSIITKYLRPSMRRGARVSAEGFGKKVIVPYKYGKGTLEAHAYAASKIVEQLDWSFDHMISLPTAKGYIFGSPGDSEKIQLPVD